MKKYFFTGLILLFPFFIAISLTIWLFYFLSIPFYSIYHSFFSNTFLSRVLSLVSVVIFVILFGYVTQYFIVKKFITGVQKLFTKVPFVRSIYHATSETVSVLTRNEARGFSETVLVSHPSESSKIVGFIPRRDIQVEINLKEKLIPVYIPGTVNPLMGFLIFTTKDYIQPLQITSEQAFVWNISLGTRNPFIKNELNN